MFMTVRTRRTSIVSHSNRSGLATVRMHITDAKLVSLDPAEPIPRTSRLLLLAAAGGAVATALGVYGRCTARPECILRSRFPSMKAMKSFFSQTVESASWLYRSPLHWPCSAGCRSSRQPRRGAFVHRWSGTVAFVVSLPVAYHCRGRSVADHTDSAARFHGLFGCGSMGR